MKSLYSTIRVAAQSTAALAAFAVILSPIATFAPIGTRTVLAAPPDFSVSMFPFNLSGGYSEEAGQPTGAGAFSNGGLTNYPEGSCIPILVEVENKTADALDILITPYFDYYNDASDQVGVADLEYVSSTALDPMGLANLNEMVFSEQNLADANLSFITIIKQGQNRTVSSTVSAVAEGPFAGNDELENPTTPTDEFRHYNVTLQDVPGGETVEVLFCARLDVDASQYANGGPMSVRVVQGGAENVSIQAGNLLELPSITLTKVVSSGTAEEDEFSFIIAPGVDTDGDGDIETMFDIPDGQSSVIINNVSPDGVYSIVETGPDGYSFVSGTGTNCLFNGQTASATVAAGEPPMNAECIFTNAADASTITVTKVVTNDNGGTALIENFSLFVDETQVTSGVATSFAPGTYTISEIVPLELQTQYAAGEFTGDCSPDGTIVLGEAQGLTCTITNDDLPATLTVIKTVVGGSLTAPDFTLDVEGPTEIVPFPGSETGTVFIDLNAGSYTVSEEAEANYTGTFSAECPDGVVDLANGESVICTLSNTYTEPLPGTGSLTVTKNVVNDNGGALVASDFSFTVEDNNGVEVVVFPGNELGHVVENLLPGTYTVSETPLDGYLADFSACGDDGVVTVVAGLNTSCTVVNDDQPATLTVIKDVQGDTTHKANDFTIVVTEVEGDGSNDHSDPGDEVGIQYVIDAGDYVISELDNLGAETVTFVGHCDTLGNLSVALGESYTCTIINDFGVRDDEGDEDPTTATITVIKLVDGGEAESSNFEITVASEEANFTTTFPGSDAGTNTIVEADFDYIVSEVLVEDYEGAFSGACDQNGLISDVVAGETYTCTITNTFVPRDGGGGDEPDDDDNDDGGGGCGTCGERPDNPDSGDNDNGGDEPNEPNQPPGEVLGETDEVPPPAPVEAPAPQVLGAEDELPKTGIPSYVLLLSIFPILWAIKRDA